MRLAKIFIPLLLLVLTSCSWDDFLLSLPFKPDVCGKTIPLTQEIKDLREKAKTSLEIENENFVVHGEAIWSSETSIYRPESNCVIIIAEIQKENTFVPDKRFDIKKIWAIYENEVWIWTSENSKIHGPKWPETEETISITFILLIEDKAGKQYLLKKNDVPRGILGLD